MDRIEEFRKCAAICAQTDYGEPSTVRRHNRAALRMKAICCEQATADDLMPLLLEPVARNWLAFLAMDNCSLSAEQEASCLAVIRQQANDDGLEALGASMWLEDHGYD